MSAFLLRLNGFSMKCTWLDLIATPRLCHVKTAIRQINKAVNLICLCGINCYTLANRGHRDRPLLMVFNPQRSHRLTNPFRDL